MKTVRVIPDVSGIHASFDYTVDDADVAAGLVDVGTLVRIRLQGRLVDGWVEAVDVTSPDGVTPRRVERVKSIGPPRELLELSDWAGHRWAGHRTFFMGAASPPRAVKRIPAPQVVSEERGDTFSVVQHVMSSTEAYRSYIPEVVAKQRCLVLVPESVMADAIVTSLRRRQMRVGRYPEDWVLGRSGAASVVGTRSAAFAPVAGLGRIVVVDAHDESFTSERSPTWNAVDVARERARRENIPCDVISPTPRVRDVVASMEVVDDRSPRWPRVRVVDLTESDPHDGLYTPEVVRALRSDTRVVCVVNRKGRARLLRCRSCRAVAACERCSGALALLDEQLTCSRCHETSEPRCRACGNVTFLVIRAGVSHIREDLERLSGRAVGGVTGATKDLPDVRVLVGTEAVLHRVHRADVVIWLDLDQELLAPRYRASEDALCALGLSARIVGWGERGGELLLQTHQVDHPVVRAAQSGNVRTFVEAEASRRQALGWPPYSSVARISGADAVEFAERINGEVVVMRNDEGAYIVKTVSDEALAEVLGVARSGFGGSVRIEVDPPRL